MYNDLIASMPVMKDFQNSFYDKMVATMELKEAILDYGVIQRFG